MFCRKCGREYEGNFCPDCGTPTISDNSITDTSENVRIDYSKFSSDKKVKNKLTERSGFIVFMLILFFPVGIYFMWKNSKWNNFAKILVTMFFVFMFAYVYNHPVPSSTDTSGAVSSKGDSKKADGNSKDAEDTRTALLKFDEQTWEDFKILYNSHNNFMKSISAYSDNQANSLDFYNVCADAKDYFANASTSYDYGTTDEEKTYLSAFELVALSDQQAAEKLIKYIDSGKTSDLSKAQEYIQRAKDALVNIAENRGTLLVKAGLTDKEIKKKVEADMAELESTE